MISNSERQLEQNMLGDWDFRRTAFVEHIQKINPDAHDAGYVKSLESVVAAKEGLSMSSGSAVSELVFQQMFTIGW
jgi:hypothetical protein